MHRWDLGTALGRDLGYPAVLAADGVDEVVTCSSLGRSGWSGRPAVDGLGGPRPATVPLSWPGMAPPRTAGPAAAEVSGGRGTGCCSGDGLDWTTRGSTSTGTAPPRLPPSSLRASCPEVCTPCSYLQPMHWGAGSEDGVCSSANGQNADPVGGVHPV